MVREPGNDVDPTVLRVYNTSLLQDVDYSRREAAVLKARDGSRAVFEFITPDRVARQQPGLELGR
jgi:hypothetical protein